MLLFKASIDIKKQIQIIFVYASRAQRLSPQKTNCLLFRELRSGKKRYLSSCLRQTELKEVIDLMGQPFSRKNIHPTISMIAPVQPTTRRHMRITCKFFVGWRSGWAKFLLADTELSHIFTCPLPRANVANNVVPWTKTTMR